jgi:acyl-CoA thioester hydrolase
MRVKILEEIGLTMKVMTDLSMGPILFREEAKFLREVGMQDTITITCRLIKARKDGSRWSFEHEIFKRDGMKSAIITVDGAWIDINKRKLTAPPIEIAETFLSMPKSEDFEWV